MSRMCVEESLTPVLQKSWEALKFLDRLRKLIKSYFENNDNVLKGLGTQTGFMSTQLL